MFNFFVYQLQLPDWAFVASANRRMGFFILPVEEQKRLTLHRSVRYSAVSRSERKRSNDRCAAASP
jgi:hypothetical protein